MQKRNALIVVAVATVAGLISSTSHAEETLTHWLSVASPNIGTVVFPGSEQVDPLSGMLTVTRRDLHLPGPAGLDIDILRVYRSFPNAMGTNENSLVSYPTGAGCSGPPTGGVCAIVFGAPIDPVTTDPTYNQLVNGNAGVDSYRAAMPVGFDWQIHFGRVYLEGLNTGVCTNSAWTYTPLNYSTDISGIPETDLDQLPVFEAQDGSRRIMYLAQGSADGVPTYLSQDRWQLKCATTPYLLSPDGLRLDLGISTTDPASAAFSGTGSFTFLSSVLWVSKITDRFGNYVSITYDAPTQTIRQVTGSDGRQVTFNYVNSTNTDIRLQSVVANTGTNTRTVSYSYSPISTNYSYLPATGKASFYLHTVSYPQGLSETYDYFVPTADSARTHWNPKRDVLKTITTPYGGAISFDYANLEVPGYFSPAGITGTMHNLSTAVISMTKPGGTSTQSLQYSYTITPSAGSNGIRVFTQKNLTDSTSIQRTFTLNADPSSYGLPGTDYYLDASGLKVRQVTRAYDPTTYTSAVECTYTGESLVDPTAPAYGSTPCTIHGGSNLSYPPFKRMYACTMWSPAQTGLTAFGSNNFQSGGLPQYIPKTLTQPAVASTNGCFNFTAPPPDNFYNASHTVDSGSVYPSGEWLNGGLTGAVRISDNRWVAKLASSTQLNDDIVGRGIYIWRAKSITTTEYNAGTAQSTHVWTPTAYDSYNNITGLTETLTSPTPAHTRTTTLSYCTAQETRGLLSEMKSKSVTIDANPSQTWSATMDGNCMPLIETAYGRQTTYTYNPDAANCPGSTSPGDICSKQTSTGVSGEATRIHTYTNYMRGIPQNEKFPDTTTISRVVDVNGWVTSVTDQNLYSTGASYDGLGRLKTITPPQSGSAGVTITYPTPTTQTVTRGSRVENLTVDGLGRTISSAVGGITTTYQFDIFGRKIFESYPGGTSGVSTTYDVLGRPLKSTNTIDASFKSWTYRGIATDFVDERSKKTTTTYLAFSDPDEKWEMAKTQVDAGVTLTTNRNDSLGRVTSLVEGGATHSFTYDAHACLWTETYTEIGTITYTRDAQCNTRSVTWPGTSTNTYVPDTMDRPHVVNYVNGTQSTQMLVNYWPDGKIQSTGLAGVTRSYSYDNNRNLASESLAIDGLTFATSYGYDALDHLNTITYPLTGTVLTYTPDVLGRPTQVLATRNGTQQSIVNSGMAYYPSGALQTVNYANGVVGSYLLSPRLWPSSVKYAVGSTTRAQIGFGFDTVGNITSITDTTRPTYGVGTLGYDGLNRLIGYGSAGSPCDICYDAAGNLTKLSINGGSSTTLSYTNNLLMSISGARTGSYLYDPRGNIKSDPTYTYTYDAGSRLSQASLKSTGAALATYGYDAGGVRVKATQTGKSAVYTFYDHTQRALVDYDKNTSAITEYFYLAGKQVAKRSTVPSPTSGGAVPLSVSAGMIKSSGQVTLKIGLPNTATGTITVTNAATGTTVTTGQVVNGVMSFPANLLTNKSGCYKLTVSYSGDLNYAPGTIGTVTECINFPMAAILELLLGN